MLHSFLAAWRVSLRRTSADWPILVAAAIITVVASTLLAAGPVYSGAVAEAGLHRLLRVAPTRDVNVEVTTRAAPSEADAIAASVEGVLREAVGTPVDIRAAGLTSSFALPEQPEGGLRDLATLAFLDGLADHATLVAGTWPAPAAPGAPIDLAVFEPVAAALGLVAGETLSLTSRLDPGLVVEGVVAGIYRPDDPSAAFWYGDRTLLEGITDSPEYRTFGPLIATREDLLARAGGSNVRLTWHAFPIVEAIAIDGVPGLRERMAGLQARMTAALPDALPSTRTGLPALLAGSEQSLLVSRTGVLLLLIQLAVLAGYAIALTADLIVDHRRVDTALLRSRGASTRQVALLALAEALLLAVPGALLGPWLAALALRLFNVAGPLAGIGLSIDPRLTADAYVVAASAALGCALLIVLPAFIAARSFASERSATSRPGTRPLGQRIGLDLALVAVTAVGLWQLQLYGTPLTRTVRGTIGIDPLLIAAPAIGILAGGVVALRIVPLLAQAADALSARGRDLVSSLGARQLARRPLRYTRTAMLIMLAVAMGVFSVSYGTTWTGSQRQQADFQVGADLRVRPERGVDALDDSVVGPAYAAEPGVAAVMPVVRDSVRYTRTSGAGELIALDATIAHRVVTGLPDAGATASALAAARPAFDAVKVAGSPRSVAVAVDVRLESVTLFEYNPFEDDFVARPIDPAVAEATFVLRPVVTVRDARGVIHRLPGPAVQRVPGVQSLVAPLVTTAAADAVGLDYPLEVIGVAIDLTSTTEEFLEVTGALVLVGLSASEAVDGTGASPQDIGGTGDWWGGWAEDVAGIDEAPLVDLAELALDFTWNPGFGFQAVNFSFTRAGLEALRTAELPLVANRVLLEALGAGVGDIVTIQLPGGPRAARIVGVVEAFPTTRPDGPVAILDLASLAIARYAATGVIETADEWWLALDATASEALVLGRGTGALADAQVISRVETRDRLTTEPLAVGMIGALSLGFVAAGLFAVIGLAVSATVSARQRRTEFALLRALGLSPDQLSGWLWLENASVVVVSVVAGTGLGLLIGWVVLPFITVSQSGDTPFPPVTLDVPWASVAILEAISIAALVVTLVLLGRSIRRAGVGSVLRMGED